MDESIAPIWIPIGYETGWAQRFRPDLEAGVFDKPK